jgi:hypothetical protein
MLSPLALIHGTEGCKELARSALPHAPERERVANDLRRRVSRAERRVA